MRVRNSDGVFITVADWAFKPPGSDLWIFCNEESAQHAHSLNFPVTTGAIAYRQNQKLAVAATQRSVQANLRRFPGRAKASERPDGKPESGYTCPDIQESFWPMDIPPKTVKEANEQRRKRLKELNREK